MANGATMSNKKYRCLIVDDEEGAHYVLKSYIEDVESLELIGECFDALSAINFLHRNETDIIFLDINMPKLSGFDLLKSLPFLPKTILTTAYSQYALESYDFPVVDYLVKPIPFNRFLRAINRIVACSFEMPQSQSMEYLFLKVDRDVRKVRVEDVLYVQSWGNYVKIFTNKEVVVAHSTTMEIESKVPSNLFIRVHRCYLVSLKSISTISGNVLYVGKEVIPIGRSYKSAIYQRLVRHQ